MSNLFRKFADQVSAFTGHATAFMLALLVVLAWIITGPIFDFSNTWQLVINTGTTIITFLMVFLIQNTQNRDSRALHLKLDELIKVNKHASNNFINLEKMSESELDRLEEQFSDIRRK